MCTEKIIFMAGNTHEYVAKEGNCDLFCCRAPHGARGLKLEKISYPQFPQVVAPRTGRVD